MKKLLTFLLVALFMLGAVAIVGCEVEEVDNDIIDDLVEDPIDDPNLEP